MKYMGGKYFLAKDISRVIKESVSDKKITEYLEPFCGALSVLTHMNEDYNCVASDYHPDLIQLWKEVQDGTFQMPKFMNEQEYLRIKELESPSALKAFAGFGLSFGGKFFSGYANKYKNDKKEDFLQEAINSLTRKHSKIQKVEFICKEYDKWNPVNKIIYCDPPYQITKNPIKYRIDTKHYDEFDNTHFWEVMRKWSNKNYVFISETHAPEDFVPIWHKESYRSASQSKKTRFKNESENFTVEKLFVHKDSISRLNLKK